MSATNRPKKTGERTVRRENDHYETPSWATRAVLNALDLGSRSPKAPATILDPGCGSGAIIREAARRFPNAACLGVEIHPMLAAGPHEGYAVECADFLSWNGMPGFDLAIGNPPYNLAHEFICKAMEVADRVVFLLRLNYLGSMTRAAWHRAHPSNVYVLPKRPSFTADGKTDACEYAWFEWPGEGRIGVLDLKFDDPTRGNAWTESVSASEPGTGL